MFRRLLKFAEREPRCAIEWRLFLVLVFTSWHGRPSLSVNVKWEDRQKLEGKKVKKNRKEICAKQTNMKNREGIIFWGILDLIFLRAVIDDVPKNTKKIYGFSPLDKKSIFTCVLWLVDVTFLYVCVWTSHPPPPLPHPHPSLTSSCSSRTLSSHFFMRHETFFRSSISFKNFNSTLLTISPSKFHSNFDSRSFLINFISKFPLDSLNIQSVHSHNQSPPFFSFSLFTTCNV